VDASSRQCRTRSPDLCYRLSKLSRTEGNGIILNPRALAESVFEAVDAMRPEAFGEFLSEDGIFTFGNMPTAKGRAATVAAVSRFFGSIAKLKHEIVGVWQQGDTVFVQLSVRYTRKDGKILTLPCANIWKLDRNNKIADYSIFMDINPVFA